MESLRLILSDIDGTKFRVSVDKRGEEVCSFPFLKASNNSGLSIVLNALNWLPENLDDLPDLNEYSDQVWMEEEGLLSEDRREFSLDIREKIGTQLYNALFYKKIRDFLIEDLGKISYPKERLHIQLQYQADQASNSGSIHISNLSRYPWHLAHDGKEFLAARKAVFSYLIAHGSSLPILEEVQTVKVLLISSQAVEQPSSAIKSKGKAISRGLAKARDGKKIQLLSWYRGKKRQTLSALREYLTDYKSSERCPNIVHFDGHGVFKKRCLHLHCQRVYPINQSKCECGRDLPEPKGFLLFETERKENKNEQLEATYVSADDFARVLSICQPSPVLVVITACRSAQAQNSSSVFNGVAQALIQEGVPAVVATPFNISEESTTDFVEQFYRALGTGRSLLDAVRLGCDAMQYKDYEWYRFTVYMRHEGIEDGYLFKVNENLKYPEDTTSEPRQNKRKTKPSSKVFDIQTGQPIDESLSNAQLKIKEIKQDVEKAIELVKPIKTELEKGRLSSSIIIPSVNRVNSISPDLEKELVSDGIDQISITKADKLLRNLNRSINECLEKVKGLKYRNLKLTQNKEELKNAQIRMRRVDANAKLLLGKYIPLFLSQYLDKPDS